MIVLGVEFSSNWMNYVVVGTDGQDLIVHSSNRVRLDDSRSRQALVAFESTVVTILASAKADLIAIKDKPQSGKLMAGAPAIKMEAILLVRSQCDVRFVSGARINKCAAMDGEIFAYLIPAFKAAAAVVEDE